DRGADLLALLLARTHGVHRMPDGEQRLERNHHLVVLGEVADQHQDLPSHGTPPAPGCANGRLEDARNLPAARAGGQDHACLWPDLFVSPPPPSAKGPSSAASFVRPLPRLVTDTPGFAACKGGFLAAAA